MKIKWLIAGGAVLTSAILGAMPVHADSDVYKVAYIYPEQLIVRAEPSTDAREIDRVLRGQEVEVVQECGDWAKVCIALDSYGYINAYHFAYRTYYADGTVSSNEEVTEDYLENYDYDYNYEEDYDYDYSYDYKDSYDYDYNYDYDYDYSDEVSYVNEVAYTYDDSYYDESEDTTSYDDNYSEDYTYDDDYEEYSREENSDESYYEEVDEESFEEDYYENTSYEEENQSSNSGGQSISNSAKQYVGNPYVWGGESLTTGADCSGFTKAILESNGYSVNGRTAADQAAGGTQVSLDEAQAGDLIYYNNGNGVYHIAVYNGDGTVTHSSSSTTGVIVSDMNYSGNAAGAVRYW